MLIHIKILQILFFIIIQKIKLIFTKEFSLIFILIFIYFAFYFIFFVVFLIVLVLKEANFFYFFQKKKQFLQKLHLFL